MWSLRIKALALLYPASYSAAKLLPDNQLVMSMMLRGVLEYPEHIAGYATALSVYNYNARKIRSGLLLNESHWSSNLHPALSYIKKADYRTGGNFRGWKFSCNSRFCLI